MGAAERVCDLQQLSTLQIYAAPTQRAPLGAEAANHDFLKDKCSVPHNLAGVLNLPARGSAAVASSWRHSLSAEIPLFAERSREKERTGTLFVGRDEDWIAPSHAFHASRRS